MREGDVGKVIAVSIELRVRQIGRAGEGIFLSAGGRMPGLGR